MVTKLLRLAATTGAVLAVCAGPAAAQTTPISATLKTVVTRQAFGGCSGVFCGTATLSPFGEAEFVYEPSGIVAIDRSCADVTGVLHVTVLASGDTLDLATTSVACFPGNSANVPGTLHSYGNPVSDSGTFTVAGGSGTFAGATGSGTFAPKVAGAIGTGSLGGTLQLAG